MEESYPILEECAEVGRRTGAWAPALVALCHLAHQDAERGDLESAERRAREALAYADEPRRVPPRCRRHSGLAQVLVARGQLDEAQAHADRGSGSPGAGAASPRSPTA